MREFTKSVTVSELLQVKHLHLELVCGKRYVTSEISEPLIGRPGLALCGHLDHFLTGSIQMFGQSELSFCAKQKASVLRKNMDLLLTKGQVPCVVIAAGMTPPAELKKACLAAEVPVLKTDLPAGELLTLFSRFLDERLAPTTHLHGVLLNVSGSGVLIRGQAGIGKSECALELIKRGHILIADDVVEVQKRFGRKLVGVCPEMLKHYMEVRGLGILDINFLFGIGATLEETTINMEVVLQPAPKVIDRLGVDQRTTEILGIQIPSLSIPVTPGRNLAVLIEVAALNQQLKEHGIFSAEEFSRKMMNRMKEQTEKKYGTKA